MVTQLRSARPIEGAVGRRDKRALYLAAGTFAAAMVVWRVGAIHMGWGEAESAHAPDSLWMYARRLSMIAMAALLPVLGKTPGLREYGWRLDRRWFAIALVVGLTMGQFNRGGYRPESLALIAGAALHTFAVELYFRAYWINLLACYTDRFWPPILVSGGLYGLYQLTVFGIVKYPWYGVLALMGLFTALGIAFGYSQRRSGSFVVAFLMHFFAVMNLKFLFTGS